MNTGSNNGVHGIVDIEGSPQFGGKVLFWKEATALSKLDITGQGDSDLGDSISLIENGNLMLRCEVRRDLFPFPANLKNASGSITLTFDKGVTGGGAAAIQLAFSVRVEDVTMDYEEKKETMWSLALSFQRTGAITPSGFANNGSQPTTTARTAGNKYLYRQRSKLYDPNGLNDTSDQTFAVWGLAADTDAAEVTAIGSILSTWNTAPQTGQKQHTAIGSRLSSGVMLIRVHWSKQSTADEITNPLTYSTRSATEPATDSVGSIISNSSSSALNANYYWGLFQGTQYASGVRVLTKNDGKKILVKLYRNIGYIVHGMSKTGSRQLKARYSGGKAQLYVSDLFAYSETRALVILSYLNDYTSIIRDFVIFRQVVGTTIPENSGSSINGVALPDIGQINSGTFLGLAAGTVVYQGPKFKVDLGLTAAGNLSMLIGWGFHANDNGILVGVPSGIFNRRLIRQISASLSYTGPNYYDADKLGFPGIVQPTSAGFTAFTQPAP